MQGRMNDFVDETRRDGVCGGEAGRRAAMPSGPRARGAPGAVSIQLIFAFLAGA